MVVGGSPLVAASRPTLSGYFQRDAVSAPCRVDGRFLQCPAHSAPTESGPSMKPMLASPACAKMTRYIAMGQRVASGRGASVHTADCASDPPATCRFSSVAAIAIGPLHRAFGILHFRVRVPLPRP